MAQQQMTSSQKALMLELKSLQEEPVEGFRITLVDESDLYNWEVAIFGPPNTLYEGGYFKVPAPPLRLPRAEAAVFGCFPAESGSAGERRGLLTSAAPSPHPWRQEGLACSPGAFSLSWGRGREASLHREIGKPLWLG